MKQLLPIESILKYSLLLVLFSFMACKTTYVYDCPDRDKDGVPDAIDKCPDLAGDITNYGCPFLDTDGDGILDKDDECPDEAGDITNNGCPLMDTDGDSVADRDDECPDQAGLPELNGCPEIVIVHAPDLSIGELLLPPPSPTEFSVLDPVFFNAAANMGMVDKIINKALQENGYIGNKYLNVNNGFALITQIEQIDDNGFSVPIENRWVEETWRSKEFSIREFFKLLLTEQPGYYRCIVFIVTKDSFSFSEEETNREQIDVLYNNGNQILPFEIAEIPFTARHSVTANIYEFKKLENEEVVKFNINSPIKGRHLINSKIIESLKQ